MSVDNAILFTLITTLLSFNVGDTFAECISSTACTCVMSNGEFYDLSKITGQKDDFIVSQSHLDRKFYFHPCNDKILNITVDNNTIKSTACDQSPGVTLCLLSSKQFANLGTASENKWIFNSNAKPQISVEHVSGNNRSTVTIDLVCNPGEENSEPVLAEYDSSTAPNYKLVLLSHQACRKQGKNSGLSTGSVLVIIFFMFSGLYFVGGALTLKLLRGATGWEMLPNQKFWFDLPVLVRDGVAFTFNGCKVVSYDQI